MEDLKPCVWCGGTEVELFPELCFGEIVDGYYVIFCGNCFRKTVPYSDIGELVSDWNSCVRRADDGYKQPRKGREI